MLNALSGKIQAGATPTARVTVTILIDPSLEDPNKEIMLGPSRPKTTTTNPR